MVAKAGDPASEGPLKDTGHLSPSIQTTFQVAAVGSWYPFPMSFAS